MCIRDRNFKIYRWDPNEKVRTRRKVRRSRRRKKMVLLYTLIECLLYRGAFSFEQTMGVFVVVSGIKTGWYRCRVDNHM